MAQWSKRLTLLRDALASLLPSREEAIPYLETAGINTLVINLTGNPITMWHSILRYASNNSEATVLAIVDAVLEAFPKNPSLLAYKTPMEEDYGLGPDIKDAEWKGDIDKDNVEKITGNVSTLLPIRFLSIGLQRARSVARIFIPKGNKAEVGTGFLLPGNLLLTNNHVLPDPATAAAAEIQFDYEEAENGNPLAITPFNTNPAAGFATSETHDWTAVRLEGDANTTFGAIEFTPGITVVKNDFVNIIQHPGGGYKQIGLYHNIVTFSNDKIVQYLTDTEPGSSGSPVFNSDWQLVALHHSGGMLREPGISKRLLRNEGININIVQAGLTENKLI